MTMQDDSARKEAKKAIAAGQARSRAAKPAQSGQAARSSDIDTLTISELTERNGATSSLLSVLKTGGQRLSRRFNQVRQAANLHKIRLTAPPAETDTTVPVAASVSSDGEDTEPRLPALFGKRRKRKARKDRLQDWDKWSKFRLWRRTRPLAGSILMFLSSLLLLAIGIYFLPFAFLANTVWISLFLGGMLLIMALIQLFLPTYSVMTGSIGILVSLVSFFTSSFGGLFIGMVLGIIGGALSLSWRPVKRARLVARRSTSTNA